MMDNIMMWVGYMIVLALGLLSMCFLFWVIYYCYDYWLKKLLGWKEMELRADLFYFIKHKE